MKKMDYGWKLVLLSALILATNSIAIYGFGVFLKPLTGEFGWERGAISGAFSVGILLHGFLSIATGRFSDRYGPRILATIAGLALAAALFLMSRIDSLWQVYLVWGLFIGITLSCSVVPVTSAITRWFTKRRGMAIAVSGCGFSLGAIVTPLVIQWLISDYGWQQAFVILGFVPLLLTTVAAQFLGKYPASADRLPDETNELEPDAPDGDPGQGLSFSGTMKLWHFWVFAFLHFGVGFCLQMITVHIVPHAIDSGIPEIGSASILSIIAGSSLAGRVLSGILSDRLSGRRVLAGSLVLMTLGLGILMFTGGMWSFTIFAIVFGLAHGGIVTMLSIVVAELFGLKSIGMIWGAIMLFGTVGGAVGAPASGFIFDITRSYDISFITGIGIAAVTVILGIILLRPVRHG